MGRGNYIVLRHYSPYKKDKKFSNIRDNITNQGIYFFGKVTAINTATKEVVFSSIENKLGAGKLGTAQPMSNNIKLPDIGSIVTLQRAPTPEVNSIGSQYNKTIYYIGPIAINQTVDNNTIEASVDQVNNSVKVNQNNINSSIKGIPQNNSASPVDVIFISGLYNRAGDWSVSKQTESLQTAVGTDKIVRGFAWDANLDMIINFIKANLNATVVMFSQGCKWANNIASIPLINKNKIWIVEPYAVNGNKSVSSAVSKGVPANHVLVGPNSARGKGVVNGAISSEASCHFCSVASAGRMIKKTLSQNT